MKTCYSCGLENIHLKVHHGFDGCKEEIYLQGKQEGDAEPSEFRMMARVKQGATSLARNMGYTQLSYLQALLRLEGRWIEIETEFLFVNQFNTVPTEFAENGLRLYEVLTDRVVNDLRKYEAKEGEEKRLYL